jgi:hypothetical protein
MESNSWSPRAVAYPQLSLVTGGREMLTTLAGMQLYEPNSEGLVFMDQLSPSDISKLLDMAEHIYVYNGDITELIVELTDWNPEQLEMLYHLGAQHTTDENHNWVYGDWPMKAGYTLNPTLYTNGRCNFSVTINPTSPGPNDLYLKLLRSPGAGNLTIDVPGLPPQIYAPTFPDDQMAWVKFNLGNLTGPTTITIGNDGTGSNYLEQLLVASPDEMATQVEKSKSLLGDNLQKLVYVYQGTSYFNSTRHILGTEGWGVAPNQTDGVLSLTTGNLFQGHQYVQVYNIGDGDQISAELQGANLSSVPSTMRGKVFDAGTMAGGERLDIRTNGLYGVSIFSGEWKNASNSSASVTYSRPSGDEYQVEINSNQSLLLQISESYGSMWIGQISGSELTHIPLNSMVNGYLIEKGNHTVTIGYQGNRNYQMITGILVASLILSTSLLWFRTRPFRKKDLDG